MTQLRLKKDQNLPLAEAIKLIATDLLETRLSMNTSAGYWTLSNNPQAAHHALIKTYQLDTIKSITIMSDGFSQIYELFQLYSPAELVQQLEKANLNQIKNLFAQLKAAQDSDPEAIEYPRFKKRDDMSLVYHRF